MDDLEGCLGDLEEYPSIPAIEVTIPHFLASFNLQFLKRKLQQNKKIVVAKATIESKQQSGTVDQVNFDFMEISDWLVLLEKKYPLTVGIDC